MSDILECTVRSIEVEIDQSRSRDLARETI
jgi:hypothetical protein